MLLAPSAGVNPVSCGGRRGGAGEQGKRSVVRGAAVARASRASHVSTIFPKWTNHLPTIGALGGLGFVSTVVGLIWYYFPPNFWEVGYMPHQPRSVAIAGEPPAAEGQVGFQHLIHAGKLGMDCRYCHSHIEESAEANIPPVYVCYGCHAEGHVKSM